MVTIRPQRAGRAQCPICDKTVEGKVERATLLRPLSTGLFIALPQVRYMIISA
jgi:hypothetical protein